MGVSGSGKTVVGEVIARKLHAPFLDGDSYHPAANVAKMRSGTPLTDADRWPWLETLGKALHAAAGPKGVAVGACSALKRAYRDYLTRAAGEPVVFVYLDGSFELIDARLKARTGHFMPESLLRSQFATLEMPAPDENAIAVPIAGSVEEIAAAAVKRLGYLRAFKRGQ